MYYPKSKIKTNLYTEGGEYLLYTDKSGYTGYYYKVSSGKAYTGKNPQDGPSILLIKDYNIDPLLPPSVDDPSSIIYASDITKYYPQPYTNFDTQTYFDNPQNNQSYITRYLPIYNPTLPTDKDKDLGVFNRYFCKKTNELLYIEISKETFDLLRYQDPKIVWDLYSPLSILWQIQGDKEKTYTANKNNIAILEQRNKWYGFSKYLKEDYLKYYLGS
jgi:hypothetical protein